MPEAGLLSTIVWHDDGVTDTTVDDGSGWGYNRDAADKPLPTLLRYVVDSISKNGNAVYGSTAWTTFGERPTRLKK